MIILKKIRSFLGRNLEFLFNYQTIKDLIKISKNYSYKIIYLPSIEYDYPLFQRPQYLANYLSQSIKVLFIYLYASSNYTPKKSLIKKRENFYLSTLFRTLPYFIKNSWIMLISGQAINTIYDLKKYKKYGQKIIYDYVDEISEEICGNEKAYHFLKNRHEKIKREKLADVVFCSAKKLYDEMIAFYPKERVFYLPNGVDFDLFNKKNIRPLSDLKKIINKKKPIIGYQGAIAPWLDFELINELARRNSQWQFVFIGTNYAGALHHLNLSIPNLFYIKSVNYQRLPQFTNFIDVGLIPFKKGRIAQTVSPLKLFEYLACGKPVVATEDIKECYNIEGVFVTKNKISDFKEKISQALKLKLKNKFLGADLRKVAKENSWRKRAELFLKVIRQF